MRNVVENTYGEVADNVNTLSQKGTTRGKEEGARRQCNELLSA